VEEKSLLILSNAVWHKSCQDVVGRSCDSRFASRVSNMAKLARTVNSKRQFCDRFFLALLHFTVILNVYGLNC
jgi:hypothetical protein